MAGEPSAQEGEHDAQDSAPAPLSMLSARRAQLEGLLAEAAAAGATNVVSFDTARHSTSALQLSPGLASRAEALLRLNGEEWLADQVALARSGGAGDDGNPAEIGPLPVADSAVAGKQGKAALPEAVLKALKASGKEASGALKPRELRELVLDRLTKPKDAVAATTRRSALSRKLRQARVGRAAAMSSAAARRVPKHILRSAMRNMLRAGASPSASALATYASAVRGADAAPTAEQLARHIAAVTDSDVAGLMVGEGSGAQESDGHREQVNPARLAAALSELESLPLVPRLRRNGDLDAEEFGDSAAGQYISTHLKSPKGVAGSTTADDLVALRGKFRTGASLVPGRHAATPPGAAPDSRASGRTSSSSGESVHSAAPLAAQQSDPSSRLAKLQRSIGQPTSKKRRGAGRRRPRQASSFVKKWTKTAPGSFSALEGAARLEFQRSPEATSADSPLQTVHVVPLGSVQQVEEVLAQRSPRSGRLVGTAAVGRRGAGGALVNAGFVALAGSQAAATTGKGVGTDTVPTTRRTLTLASRSTAQSTQHTLGGASGEGARRQHGDPPPPSERGGPETPFMGGEVRVDVVAAAAAAHARREASYKQSLLSAAEAADPPSVAAARGVASARGSGVTSARQEGVQNQKPRSGRRRQLGRRSKASVRSGRPGSGELGSLYSAAQDVVSPSATMAPPPPTQQPQSDTATPVGLTRRRRGGHFVRSSPKPLQPPSKGRFLPDALHSSSAGNAADSDAAQALSSAMQRVQAFKALTQAAHHRQQLAVDFTHAAGDAAQRAMGPLRSQVESLQDRWGRVLGAATTVHSARRQLGQAASQYEASGALSGVHGGGAGSISATSRPRQFRAVQAATVAGLSAETKQAMQEARALRAGDEHAQLRRGGVRDSGHAETHSFTHGSMSARVPPSSSDAFRVPCLSRLGVRPDSARASLTAALGDVPDVDAPPQESDLRGRFWDRLGGVDKVAGLALNKQATARRTRMLGRLDQMEAEGIPLPLDSTIGLHG